MPFFHSKNQKPKTRNQRWIATSKTPRNDVYARLPGESTSKTPRNDGGGDASVFESLYSKSTIFDARIVLDVACLQHRLVP